MSRILLRARLAARAFRWWLPPPVPAPADGVLLTPPPPPGMSCATCQRPASGGLCPACTALASWTAGAAGTYPVVRDRETGQVTYSRMITWDGLYRPGRYANYQSQCDDSGLITAIRDVVGPSTTQYVNDLFDPLIEQVRGQFAALAFRFRDEGGEAA